MADSKILDIPLNNLKDALVKSKGLGECPIQPVLEIIQELGEFIADSTAYDDLLEVVVNMTKDRRSTGEAGVILLKHGTQKLKRGKQYDAIKFLGRAQVQLAMYEYRSERFAALLRCAFAYESAGLLWAARANTLLAINQVLSEYLKHGEMTVQILKCVQRLIWLELQLGRVFCALAWIEFAGMVANQVRLDTEVSAAFSEEREMQDLILGLLLLKTQFWELKWLDFLPSILDRLGLMNSRMALLYALGYENVLRSEGSIQDSETEESVKEIFATWTNQPANEDLPAHPELMGNKTVKQSSFVLGCEVVIETENIPSCVNLAETILSALEAFLATSLDSQLFPYRSELNIQIKISDRVHELPEYQIDETDSEHTIIIRQNSAHQVPPNEEEKDAFRSWIIDLIIRITFLLGFVDDSDAFIKQVVEDERSTYRLQEYSDLAIIINNIFGQTAKFKLSDWSENYDKERFALHRDKAWNHGFKDEEKEESVDFDWTPGIGEAPDGLFGVDNLKHGERRIFSLINLPLWDKAEWKAVAYICEPKSIPILILGFQDGGAANRIFEEWRRKFGEIDKGEQLRVSIITGGNRKYPSHYKVLISVNPKSNKTGGSNHFIVTSRILSLTPPDLVNLNGFIRHINRAGTYWLLPAPCISEKEIAEPQWHLRIGKNKINIRQAWQIGENDQDVVAIGEDDDPIIPQDVEDIPVLRAMQRFSKRR